MYLRIKGLIVLLYAGIDTAPAADAARQVKAVTELDARKRLLIADLNGFVVFFFAFFFKAADNVLDLSSCRVSKWVAIARSSVAR